jgi:hypothetical protein
MHLIFNSNGVNTSRKKINYTLFVRWRGVASVVTERNGTIAWVWNVAILYAFAGLQTLQSLHFCKVYWVGESIRIA